MALHSEKSTLDLKRQIAELDLKIEASCPELVKERKLLVELLRSREAGGSKMYAGVNPLGTAIKLCLSHATDGMTRSQIEETLLTGGYQPEKPKMYRQMIRQTLEYHSEKPKDPVFALVGERWYLRENAPKTKSLRKSK